MPLVLYCLLDLGIKIDKNDRDSHDFVFKYEKQFYVAGTFEKQSIAKEIVAGEYFLNEFPFKLWTNYGLN